MSVRHGREFLSIPGPSTIPDELEQRGVALVGNYALSITFGDGHRTGIFTWDALRRLSGAGDGA